MCLDGIWMVKSENMSLIDDNLQCVPYCGTMCEGEGDCKSPGICGCPEGRGGSFCERHKCNAVPEAIGNSEIISGYVSLIYDLQ